MDLRTLASVMRGAMAGREQNRQQQLLDEKLARERQMQQRQDQEYALKQSMLPMQMEQDRLTLEGARRKANDDAKRYQAEYQAPVFAPGPSVQPVAEAIAKTAPIIANLGGFGFSGVSASQALSPVVKPWSREASKVQIPTGKWQDRSELGMLPYSMEQREEKAQLAVDQANERARQFEERMKQIDENQSRQMLSTVGGLVARRALDPVAAPSFLPYGFNLQTPPEKAKSGGGSSDVMRVGKRDLPGYPAQMQTDDARAVNNPNIEDSYRQAALERLASAGFTSQAKLPEYKETGSGKTSKKSEDEKMEEKLWEEGRRLLNSDDLEVPPTDPRAPAIVNKYVQQQMALYRAKTKGSGRSVPAASGISGAMRRIDSVFKNLMEN